MLHEWFITSDTAIRSAIGFNYDGRLVVLSIIIAILACYSGFETLDRFGAASRQITKAVWLTTGAVTLGGGVWSMHFIGMLAIEMDMAVQYDDTLTLLSAAFAIAASGGAMRIVGAGDKTLARIIGGGVILGAGIGLMHYTGMAAMRMASNIRYDPLLFGVSVIVAVTLSSLALRVLVFGVESRSHVVRLGGALLMGLSITSMHYTGMAATHFIPGAEQSLLSGLVMDKQTMVIVIGGGVFIATQFTLIVSIAHRQFQQKERDLADKGIYLEKIIDNAIDGITLIKPDGEIMVVNPVVEQYFGFSAPELIGHNISLLMSDDDASHHDRYLSDAQILEPKILGRVRELSARRKDGSYFPIDLAVSSIDLPDGRYFMGVIRDISERKKAEEERDQLISELRFNKDIMEEQAANSVMLAEDLMVQKALVEENKKRSDYLARHDSLTTLPNRRFFFERLETMLAAPETPGSTVALLYIDLDKFKPVNDIMGHECGDNLLVQVAENISKCVRGTDMVARIGGDEFAVVAIVETSTANANKDAAILAERIRESLQIVIKTPDDPIATGASIGVALYPRDGGDIDDLMKSADVAMYDAKNSGRNQVRFFDPARTDILELSS